MADSIWNRIKEYVPEEVVIPNNRFGSGTYTRCGLNERFRFYRYTKGEVFLPHFDGCYPRPDGSEVSFLTFIVYLTDDFKVHTDCYSFALISD